MSDFGQPSNTPPAAAPPAPQWFVRIEPETRGPYTAEQIAQLVKEGQVTPDTPVVLVGSQSWGRAGDQPMLSAIVSPFGRSGMAQAASYGMAGGGMGAAHSMGVPPSMSFGQAVRTCLQEKYVGFEGRARPAEYWWFILFYFILVAVFGAVAGLFGAIFGQNGAIGIAILGGLAMLGMVLPGLSVTIRRMHDRGYSGWWYLLLVVLSAIPLVGFIVLIVFIVNMILRGTIGPNKYGPDPLG